MRTATRPRRELPRPIGTAYGLAPMERPFFGCAGKSRRSLLSPPLAATSAPRGPPFPRQRGEGDEEEGGAPHPGSSSPPFLGGDADRKRLGWASQRDSRATLLRRAEALAVALLYVTATWLPLQYLFTRTWHVLPLAFVWLDDTALALAAAVAFGIAPAHGAPRLRSPLDLPVLACAAVGVASAW